MITIQYPIDIKELARAGLLFTEKKRFLQLSIFILNTFAVLLIGVMVLKFLLLPQSPQGLIGSLSLSECFIVLLCVFWLGGRKRLNEWILLKKVANQHLDGKEMTIVASRNGITWEGKGLMKGKMDYRDLRYALVAQNGCILPIGLTRYLWIPYRGFTSKAAQQEFEDLIKARGIKIRLFLSYRC